MFFKCILVYTEFEILIEIPEELLSFLIGLFDNDSVLIAKIPDIGNVGPNMA